MFFGEARARVIAAALLLTAASCAGGAQQSVPPASAPSSANTSQSARQTYALSAGGVSGSVTLQSSKALPADSVSLYQERGRTTQSAGPCPNIPPIRLTNPFNFPITIGVVSFTVQLPCTVQGMLFGVSFFQIVPQPNPVTPVKVGDVTASGSTIAFTSTAKTLTLPPQTTSQLIILPETSTAEVAFPVAKNVTTNLTANAPNLPSGLDFTYTTVTGGTTYSVGCFNAFDANGIVSALQNVALVGTPSFYCHINPSNGSTITFGQVVTFDIVDPKPDRAIFEPDGPTTGFECTLANSCKVPQFSVPTTYQNFIASNALDLAICVPATAGVDCNKVANDPQGPPRTIVSKRGDFQLLVADDPSYKPGPAVNPPSTTPHAVPWDGLFRMTLSGPCKLNTGSDNENGDEPPGYTDSEQNGVGPNAEFDVTPTGSGTCSITATEDIRFITDFSNPNNPQPRSITIPITIQ